MVVPAKNDNAIDGDLLSRDEALRLALVESRELTAHLDSLQAGIRGPQQAALSVALAVARTLVDMLEDLASFDEKIRRPAASQPVRSGT